MSIVTWRLAGGEDVLENEGFVLGDKEVIAENVVNRGVVGEALIKVLSELLELIIVS